MDMSHGNWVLETLAQRPSTSRLQFNLTTKSFGVTLQGKSEIRFTRIQCIRRAPIS